MADRKLYHAIYVETPALVTMVMVLIILLNQRRRNVLLREPLLIRDNHRSVDMTRILDGETIEDNENYIVDYFGEKFDRLSAAIEASKPRPWKLRLTDALWSMEGYSDDDMDMVFEILIANKKLAECFYLRKPSLRKRWLDNFIAEQRGSG